MRKIILKNSLWMMLEKVVAIFGLIFVTSFVAKYVGPNIYGNIALALAIFQLVQIISQFGSEVIIFKRIAINVKSGVNLIRTTFQLRALTYLFASLPVLMYFYFLKNDGFIFIFAAFLACFFQSLDVFSIYYDACLKSMVNVFVNIFGLLISIFLRGLVPFFDLSPSWLALPMVIAPLVPLLIRYIYFMKNEILTPIKSKVRVKYRKYLVLSGASFAISSISVALYTRMSIFILGFLSGHDSVAIFSVASALAGSWSFVIYSFITSTLPSIFSEKNDEVAIIKTSNLMWLVIGISFFVILLAFLLSKYFLFKFYGDKYLEAFQPLLILCFSTLVSALGTISSRYIAKYSGYFYLSVKTIIVTILSLVLNYFMILFYGVIGAATSTLIIEILSLTLMNYFFRNRLVLKLHLSLLSFPFKKIIYILKRY